MRSEPVIRWSSEDFAALQQVLRTRAGLTFKPTRRASVETAAGRVMRRLRVAEPRALVALAAQDGAVFDDLMAEVTVGETYFFRDPSQFAVIRDAVIPAFRDSHDAQRRFRAWSAGCASGEEPYSVAITLQELHVPAEVLGTDVSRTRLARARVGRYGNWSLRGVPSSVTDAYFRRDGADWILDPAIRRSVQFRYLNLAVDAFPSMTNGVWGMDLILCRNVLIYFDGDTIARVAESLVASLSDNGWLLVGATDPPIHEYTACEVVQTQAGLAYRRSATGKVRRTSVAPASLPKPTARHDDAPADGQLPREIELPPPTVPPAPPISKEQRIEAPALTIATLAQQYARRDYDDIVSGLTNRAAEGTLTATEWVVYIRSLANLGRLDEAGRASLAALDRYGEEPELHYLHAILVGEAGRHVESARAAKRAIYLDRSLIVAHLALGSALARARDFDAAARAFAAAERLLAALPPDEIVPASDGEPAARLLEMTRLQSRLAARGAAA